MVGLVGFRHDSAECNTPYSALVVPKVGFGVFRYVGKEPINKTKINDVRNLRVVSIILILLRGSVNFRRLLPQDTVRRLTPFFCIHTP